MRTVLLAALGCLFTITGFAQDDQDDASPPAPLPTDTSAPEVLTTVPTIEIQSAPADAAEKSTTAIEEEEVSPSDRSEDPLVVLQSKVQGIKQVLDLIVTELHGDENKAGLLADVYGDDDQHPGLQAKVATLHSAINDEKNGLAAIAATVNALPNTGDLTMMVDAIKAANINNKEQLTGIINRMQSGIFARTNTKFQYGEKIVVDGQPWYIGDDRFLQDNRSGVAKITPQGQLYYQFNDTRLVDGPCNCSNNGVSGQSTGACKRCKTYRTVEVRKIWDVVEAEDGNYTYKFVSETILQ